MIEQKLNDYVRDYIRCMQDIYYFAEKCYVVTPEGPQKIKFVKE